MYTHKATHDLSNRLSQTKGKATLQQIQKQFEEKPLQDSHVCEKKEIWESILSTLSTQGDEINVSMFNYLAHAFKYALQNSDNEFVELLSSNLELMIKLSDITIDDYIAQFTHPVLQSYIESTLESSSKFISINLGWFKKVSPSLTYHEMDRMDTMRLLVVAWQKMKMANLEEHKIIEDLWRDVFLTTHILPNVKPNLKKNNISKFGNLTFAHFILKIRSYIEEDKEDSIALLNVFHVLQDIFTTSYLNDDEKTSFYTFSLLKQLCTLAQFRIKEKSKNFFESVNEAAWKSLTTLVPFFTVFIKKGSESLNKKCKSLLPKIAREVSHCFKKIAFKKYSQIYSPLIIKELLSIDEQVMLPYWKDILIAVWSLPPELSALEEISKLSSITLQNLSESRQIELFYELAFEVFQTHSPQEIFATPTWHKYREVVKTLLPGSINPIIELITGNMAKIYIPALTQESYYIFERKKMPNREALDPKLVRNFKHVVTLISELLVNANITEQTFLLIMQKLEKVEVEIIKPLINPLFEEIQKKKHMKLLEHSSQFLFPALYFLLSTRKAISYCKRKYTNSIPDTYYKPGQKQDQRINTGPFFSHLRYNLSLIDIHRALSKLKDPNITILMYQFLFLRLRELSAAISHATGAEVIQIKKEIVGIIDIVIDSEELSTISRLSENLDISLEGGKEWDEMVVNINQNNVITAFWTLFCKNLNLISNNVAEYQKCKILNFLLPLASKALDTASEPVITTSLKSFLASSLYEGMFLKEYLLPVMVQLTIDKLLIPLEKYDNLNPKIILELKKLKDLETQEHEWQIFIKETLDNITNKKKQSNKLDIALWQDALMSIKRLINFLLALPIASSYFSIAWIKTVFMVAITLWVVQYIYLPNELSSDAKYASAKLILWSLNSNTVKLMPENAPLQMATEQELSQIYTEINGQYLNLAVKYTPVLYVSFGEQLLEKLNSHNAEDISYLTNATYSYLKSFLDHYSPENKTPNNFINIASNFYLSKLKETQTLTNDENRRIHMQSLTILSLLVQVDTLMIQSSTDSSPQAKARITDIVNLITNELTSGKWNFKWNENELSALYSPTHTLSMMLQCFAETQKYISPSMSLGTFNNMMFVYFYLMNQTQEIVQNTSKESHTLVDLFQRLVKNSEKDYLNSVYEFIKAEISYHVLIETNQQATRINVSFKCLDVLLRNQSNEMLTKMGTDILPSLINSILSYLNILNDNKAISRPNVFENDAFVNCNNILSNIVNKIPNLKIDQLVLILQIVSYYEKVSSLEVSTDKENLGIHLQTEQFISFVNLLQNILLYHIETLLSFPTSFFGIIQYLLKQLALVYQENETLVPVLHRHCAPQFAKIYGILAMQPYLIENHMVRLVLDFVKVWGKRSYLPHVKNALFNGMYKLLGLFKELHYNLLNAMMSEDERVIFKTLFSQFEEYQKEQSRR